MADFTNPMGPEGKVALDRECDTAIQKVALFQEAANGIITQIQGVIDGLKTDYSGDGAEQFYVACNSNIEQMKAMVKNVCDAYAGEQGLFRSIENQILTAEESLNESLKNTNQRFSGNQN